MNLQAKSLVKLMMMKFPKLLLLQLKWPSKMKMMPKASLHALNVLLKIEQETKMKKKKIQQDKIAREKESAHKHEVVVKKQTESIAKKS